MGKPTSIFQLSHGYCQTLNVLRYSKPPGALKKPPPPRPIFTDDDPGNLPVHDAPHASGPPLHVQQTPGTVPMETEVTTPGGLHPKKVPDSKRKDPVVSEHPITSHANEPVVDSADPHVHFAPSPVGAVGNVPSRPVSVHEVPDHNVGNVPSRPVSVQEVPAPAVGNAPSRPVSVQDAPSGRQPGVLRKTPPATVIPADQAGIPPEQDLANVPGTQATKPYRDRPIRQPSVVTPSHPPVIQEGPGAPATMANVPSADQSAIPARPISGIPGSVHDAPASLVHTSPAGSVHGARPGSLHGAPAGSVHGVPAGSVYEAPAGTTHTPAPGGLVHQERPGLVTHGGRPTTASVHDANGPAADPVRITPTPPGRPDSYETAASGDPHGHKERPSTLKKKPSSHKPLQERPAQDMATPGTGAPFADDDTAAYPDVVPASESTLR